MQTYLCLSILAAAALHGEEPGEAEDGEDERADRHCSGEVQIGAGALSPYLSNCEKKFGSLDIWRRYS